MSGIVSDWYVLLRESVLVLTSKESIVKNVIIPVRSECGIGKLAVVKAGRGVSCLLVVVVAGRVVVSGLLVVVVAGLVVVLEQK